MIFSYHKSLLINSIGFVIFENLLLPCLTDMNKTLSIATTRKVFLY